MLDKLQFFFFLIIISACSNNGTTKIEVSEDLEVLPHLTGATTRGLAIHDFSIAQGYEILFDTTSLKHCWCDLSEDTLKVIVGYRSEVVEFPEFTIVDSRYSTRVVFESDAPDYDNSHTMVINVEQAKLKLNSNYFEANDTLLGEMYVKSEVIKHDEWNIPIVFEGRFQCIVKKKEHKQ